MALAETPQRVFQRGTWPGIVTFRRGWARAEARPWNDVHQDAVLRVVRGGTSFISACAGRLTEVGAPSVLSTPLAASATKPWELAGFEPHLSLALMRLSLDAPVAPPEHLVVRDDAFDLDLMLEVDKAAFSEFWRFDHAALVESTQATGRSSVFVIRDGDSGLAGYAVLGHGHVISYLQRLAVHPAWQGHGMGRSLVRAVARAARRSGSKALLLNTQHDNESAIGLYEALGFVKLPESLSVLKAG